MHTRVLFLRFILCGLAFNPISHRMRAEVLETKFTALATCGFGEQLRQTSIGHEERRASARHFRHGRRACAGRNLRSWLISAPPIEDRCWGASGGHRPFAYDAVSEREMVFEDASNHFHKFTGGAPGGRRVAHPTRHTAPARTRETGSVSGDSLAQSETYTEAGGRLHVTPAPPPHARPSPHAGTARANSDCWTLGLTCNPWPRRCGRFVRRR